MDEEPYVDKSDEYKPDDYLEGANRQELEAYSTEIRKKKLWTKILMWLGFRSQCCGAEINEWDDHHFFCKNCDKRL
jgi:hypothetical protein